MAPLTLLIALVLGLARAAAPGPANAESIRRGRDGGFRPAFLVQAGFLAGELGWAVLAFVGLAMMLQDAVLRTILAIAAGALLVGLGLASLRAAATDTGLPEIDPAVRRPGRGAFGTGASFAGTALASPFLWLGLGSWLARVTPVGGGLGGPAAFLGVFAAGWLAWAAGLGALLARAGSRVTPGFVRAVDAAAGLALGAVGIVVLAGTLAGGG